MQANPVNHHSVSTCAPAGSKPDTPSWQVSKEHEMHGIMAHAAGIAAGEAANALLQAS